MKPVKMTARMTTLNEETHAIHRANSLYWKQGQSQTVAAKAQYQFRQDRLEKIRAELAQLQSLRKGKKVVGGSVVGSRCGVAQQHPYLERT
jgi:hypothetical protein